MYGLTQGYDSGRETLTSVFSFFFFISILDPAFLGRTWCIYTFPD